EVSFSSPCADEKSSRLLPARVRRSRRCFPLFLVASNEEKTTAKKLSPCEVLLIRGAIPRFSTCRHLRQPSHHFAVRGRHRMRFSLFLVFLPSSQPG
ncbi:hypothetical protein B296_00042363, partial [Ensete ventricosum]